MTDRPTDKVNWCRETSQKIISLTAEKIISFPQRYRLTAGWTDKDDYRVATL